jgi:type VI secretion system protein ImpC
VNCCFVSLRRSEWWRFKLSQYGGRMKRESNFGEVNLDVSVGREPRRNPPQDETPFRVALIGDFSGRAPRHPARLEIRQPIAVDRDNFDQVLAKVQPAIQLPASAKAAPETLTFSQLDDFHPDRLLQRSAMFRKLRDLRVRLQDPSMVASVLDELGISSSAPSREAAEKDAVRKPSTTAQAASLASGSLLDDMIAQTESHSGEGTVRKKDELREFAQRAAAAHTIAAADPRQKEVLAVIDRALGLQMRSLLHFPLLQTLEAAWRAVFLLVRRIPTSSQLKLYLLDISREELAADLFSSSDLRQCGAYRLLVEKTVGTPGAEPWALLAADFVFGPSREDAELLGRIGKIARAAGAVFLAEASPKLLGCESLAATPDSRDWQEAFPDAGAASAWKGLRSAAEAAHSGLALPRFLLRLPYGKDTDPIEAFPFEEVPDAPSHEHYLWGNPAFACALLLAQSFAEDGWQMRPGRHLEIDRLPLHVFKADGQTETQPCAEALMTEHTAESLLEKGLIPLASIKDQDTIRVVRFQSIADPLRPLAGPWTI